MYAYRVVFYDGARGGQEHEGGRNEHSLLGVEVDAQHPGNRSGVPVEKRPRQGSLRVRRSRAEREHGLETLHPLASSHPPPRSGGAILIGTRRSTRRLGPRTVLLPMIASTGAPGGSVYEIR